MPTTIDPSSSRMVVLKPDKDGKTRIHNKKTGQVAVLHGYGSMEGKLKLRTGIDLTKPIYEQVLKLEARARRKSSKSSKRKSSTKRGHKNA